MTTGDRPYGGYVFDLDGTLYLGETPIPGASATVAELRRRGARVAFLTNKPLERPAAYAAKLTRLGIAAEPEEVVTSLDSLVRYFRLRPPEGPLLPIAEPLVGTVLGEAGLATTDDPASAAAVVVAWDRTFDYAKLERAYRAVRRGAPLVATNPDPYCPTPDGGLPDCGAILAAIEVASGRQAAAVVGKPSLHMAETLLERLGLRPEEVVLVGDRLSTDVRMARAAGMAAALVLTGATSAEEAAQAADRPDLVVDDVTGLLDGRRRESEPHEARRR
ncbi:MAG TPA: HAD-IIA family hydrolase [Candidatus Limnocylindrales bacterium]|nr:HAD-IIA family hydrolase [Candidatus Limnocylindrales bacterium]